jgi:cysteine desulfurase/selenocysteine lyase
MEKIMLAANEHFICAAPHRFDAANYKRDFPALNQAIHGKPLVYLDSAASAQKPRQVIEALSRFYSHDYANVHRGVHDLSQRATDKFEQARETVRRFINAKHVSEIVFCRGATEAINLVAHSFGQKFLKAGDEVLITELEHHANIVPWQSLRDTIGITLKIAPINTDGEITLSAIEAAVTPRTKLISIAHISNALGTILPVAEIIAFAKSKNIPVLLDGCQAVPHCAVDMQKLGCDFYVFSGHKVFGPTGIGVLYGKKKWLEDMPPYQTGGGMIASVTFEKTTFKHAPEKFEAGTPAIAEAVGLAAAIEYISTIGMERIAAYEHELLSYALEKMRGIKGVKIIGNAKNRAAIISFVLENAHAHDVGTILDREGVAVRTGHHCTQPLMEKLGVASTARASFAFYNTREDVDALVNALHKVREIFA